MNAHRPPSCLRLSLMAAAAIAALLSSGGTRAAEVNHSTIDIDAVASRISAQSLQGSSSNTKVLGLFGSKKSTPALVGKVHVGSVTIEQGARLNHFNLRIRAVADSIHSNGADVCVGCTVIK